MKKEKVLNTHGGAREGAGRKPTEEEKVKSFGVYLKPSHAAALISKYGSLTVAIKKVKK